MAEAFARRWAPPGVEVFSAGSHPAPRVYPAAAEALREIGLEIGERVPQGLDALPEGVFDLVVGMGCGDACPAARAKRVVTWEIPDPKGQLLDQVRRTRDKIGLKVRRMLAGLRPVRLRFLPTALSGAVLLLCSAFLVMTSVSLSPVLGIPSPERALARVAGRTLQLREAAGRIPRWERRLHGFCDPSLGSKEEADQLVQWHRELARLAKDPVVLAHLGILEGEFGQLDLLRKQTARWTTAAPAPIPAYAHLLEAAYLTSPAQSDEPLLQAQSAEFLPASWFRDRLQERIARRGGDPARADRLRAADRESASQLFFRYRWMTGLDLALFFLFFGALAVFLSQPAGSSWKAGTASTPLPWPARAGMAVLVRGAGLGILLSLGYAFLPFSSHPAATLLSYLVWTLPILFLVWKYFLKPNGLSLRQELGLDVPLSGGRKLLFLALLGLGADSMGGWLIGTTGNFLHLPDHWAESFDADLVFGSRGVVLASITGMVAVGPFFEELVFRGLLYGTLRGRTGRIAAAGLSGLFFSLVHGYGILGFLTVFWSGVVFAWVYEESGSLWVPAAAHGMGNLLYALNVIAMLR